MMDLICEKNEMKPVCIIMFLVGRLSVMCREFLCLSTEGKEVLLTLLNFDSEETSTTLTVFSLFIYLSLWRVWYEL